MSFEKDITIIKELVDLRLDEGFAKAKERFVDTIDPATGKGEMPLFVLKKIASKDPTYPDKGKYVEWMADKYVRQGHTIRGLDVVKEFDKLLNSPHLEKRDINQYASIEDLNNAVHAVWAKVAEEREQKKEKVIRNFLIKADGDVGKAMKWASGEGEIRTAAAQAGEQISDEEAARRAAQMGRGNFVREYNITPEYVHKIRRKIEREQGGIFGKGFTIDEDILTKIDRKPYKLELKDGTMEEHPNGDLEFENDKVIVVYPPNQEKSQFYGRNHEYDPKDPHSLDAPWCTSYVTRHNQWKNYYGTQGYNFYIILPKNIDYVPEKKYTKVNVQVDKRGPGESEKDPVRITVWDFFDNTIPRAEYSKLFKSWGIPLKNTREG